MSRHWLIAVAVVGIGVSCASSSPMSASAEPGPTPSIAMSLPEPASPQTGGLGSDSSATDGDEDETDSQDDVRSELARLVVAENREWTECTALPKECRISTAFSGVLAEPLLTLTRDAAQRQADLGFQTLAPLNPAHDRVEVLNIEPTVERPDRWLVQFCSIDGRIIIEPGAGPSGANVIVDDEIRSSLRVLVAELSQDGDTKGQWRFVERRTIRTEAGGEGCGP